MELLTISQAARAIGVSRQTLHNWIARGWVPFLTLPSGHRRWTREQIKQIRKRMSNGEKVVTEAM